jgi:hypothetical protein
MSAGMSHDSITIDWAKLAGSRRKGMMRSIVRADARLEPPEGGIGPPLRITIG